MNAKRKKRTEWAVVKKYEEKIQREEMIGRLLKLYLDCREIGHRGGRNGQELSDRDLCQGKQG